MQSKPKLCIMGYAGSGKDTVCEYLKATRGFKYTTTSMLSAEHIIMPKLGYKYESVEECFKDRVNHRAEWYDLITAYNAERGYTGLADLVLENGNDIYCGMRNWKELVACENKNKFDQYVWVSAPNRVSPEDRSSCSIREEMTQWFTRIIDNDGSKDALYDKLDISFLTPYPNQT